MIPRWLRRRWGLIDTPCREEYLRSKREAERAHASALEGLAETDDRWGEVLEKASIMRELNRRNHFAESINAAIGGRRGA